jgi:hypothetical protein
MRGNNFSSEIKFLTRAEIEPKKWDACITHAVNELPYAYSWYLDSVCKHWDALVYKDYEAVFPLPGNKKAGVEYLFQPFFTQQLGLFSVKVITPSILEQFLNAIPDKFKLVEINLNTKNLYTGSLFSIKAKLTHHLLLNRPHEKIKEGYNDNCKRNLKKAQKENLQVTNDVSPSELITLFKNNQGNKVKELKAKDYQRLKTLMETALKYKRGELLGIKTPENKLCAAGFFVRGEHSVINLFPSTTEEGKKNGASFMLIDAVLNKYEQSGLVFDFEGSEISSIARFYKSFGGQEAHYWHIRRNNLPWHLKWLKK